MEDLLGRAARLAFEGFFSGSPFLRHSPLLSQCFEGSYADAGSGCTQEAEPHTGPTHSAGAGAAATKPESPRRATASSDGSFSIVEGGNRGGEGTCWWMSSSVVGWKRQHASGISSSLYTCEDTPSDHLVGLYVDRAHASDFPLPGFLSHPAGLFCSSSGSTSLNPNLIARTRRRQGVLGSQRQNASCQRARVRLALACAAGPADPLQRDDHAVPVVPGTCRSLSESGTVLRSTEPLCINTPSMG